MRLSITITPRNFLQQWHKISFFEAILNFWTLCLISFLSIDKYLSCTLSLVILQFFSRNWRINYRCCISAELVDLRDQVIAPSHLFFIFAPNTYLFSQRRFALTHFSPFFWSPFLVLSQTPQYQEKNKAAQLRHSYTYL